ncbi:MAG: hypothetical protein ABI614_27595, partial [Planctomycetota bacterium]
QIEATDREIDGLVSELLIDNSVRYPACSGACDLPGTRNPFQTLVWKAVLITSSICAAIAVVLFLKFPFGTPPGSGQQPLPNAEQRPTEARPRSSLTLPEKQAYVSALKPSDTNAT